MYIILNISVFLVMVCSLWVLVDSISEAVFVLVGDKIIFAGEIRLGLTKVIPDSRKIADGISLDTVRIDVFAELSVVHSKFKLHKIICTSSTSVL